MLKAFSSALATYAMLACVVCLAAQPVSYRDGQAVQVREGDQWSPATVVKREGRRYLIRYDGENQEEWVTADRLRGASDSTGVAPGGPDPAQTEADSDDAADATSDPAGTGNWRDPRRGDRVVIVQGFGRSQTGRVLQTRPGQVLVSLDGAGDRGGRWMDVREVRVAGLRWDVKVGQRVQFRDMGGWATGTVLEREPERARVRKDGTRDDRSAQWKPLDELRPASATDVPSPAPDGEASDELRATPGYKDADLSEVQTPPVAVEDAAAQLSADAHPSAAGATSRPVIRAMVVRGATGDALPTAIVAPRAGTPVVVVASQAQGTDQISVDRFDLDAGRPAGGVDVAVSKEMRLTDVSPDGKRVLFRRLDRFGRAADRLEIWRIDQPKGARELLLFPYAAQERSDRTVQFAAFLTDERIVTTSRQQLHIWDAATGKAIYQFPYQGDTRPPNVTVRGNVTFQAIQDNNTRPAISASGRYIAFTTGTEAVVIEAATGKVLLQLPQPLVHATRFAFSPSGAQLLACDTRILWAVDLESGELSRQFGLPGNITADELASPGDGYALVNNSVLVDLEHSCPIWKYELPKKASAAVLPSGRFMYALAGEARSKGQLLGATIPHPGAVRAAKGLKTGELVIKPGVSVALQMNVQCSDQERAAITQHLTEELKRNGMVVASGPQAVQLLASVEVGQSEQRAYGSGMMDRFAQKVTITPKLSWLRFTYQGKVVWQATASSIDPGSLLFTQRGKTLQQSMDEQTRPNLDVFTKIRLPAYVLMPQASLYLGATELSANGMRDKKADPEPDPLKARGQTQRQAQPPTPQQRPPQQRPPQQPPPGRQQQRGRPGGMPT